MANYQEEELRYYKWLAAFNKRGVPDRSRLIKRLYKRIAELEAELSAREQEDKTV